MNTTPRTIAANLDFQTACGSRMGAVITQLADGRYQLWYRFEGESETLTFDTLHELQRYGVLMPSEFDALGIDIWDALDAERQQVGKTNNYDIHVILDNGSLCPCSLFAATADDIRGDELCDALRDSQL